MRDRSFWGMGVTQFLGAFNDNLFKQLLLLLATPAAAELAAGAAEDRQGEATILFGAAFLIFSGFAGWLADRTSKRTLIIASKVAEIAVMLLGVVGFLYYDTFGLTGMFAVLFLMGVQSAFFGPPKYGILPEMLRDSDLPRANGIFLMFTFVAIIFGTVLAKLFSNNPAMAWRGSLICVAIAVAGTLTALLVRRVPPAVPGSKLRTSDLFVPPEMLRLVMRDRQLLLALVVTSSFWLLGALVIQVVNALGITQFGLGDGGMIALTAATGIGIPIGCVVGGYLSSNCINPRVVLAGAAGATVCLVLLALPGGQQGQLLGFWGSLPTLVVLGFFTGMFVVPIQVSLQVLPPAEDKGRMIALMNQCNFVGIIVGGFLYQALSSWLNANRWPSCTGFAVCAAIMLPIALFYRPKEVRLGD
jgi:acyl-[acyl-carrier-protein]-phospholipid O-acyltransferase/long-chain-fatty-acid--[acyl-carrier-protein] ligase